MRIAIGTSGLPPAAGIGTYVDQIARWFICQHHDVMVFQASATPIDKHIYPYPVFHSQVPASQTKEMSLIQALYYRLREFRPDVILNNDNIYISGILPTIDPKIIRLSIVHGYRELVGWDAHKIINSAAIYNYHYLDWIVAISKYMQIKMRQKHHFLSGLVQLIYNGIEPPESEFIPISLRANKSELKFIFAGGGNHTKGADTLLEACKRLGSEHIPRIKVYWAGNLAKKGKFSQRELSKIKFVEPIGLMPRKKLLRMMSGCHFLLMPSRAEACPMLLLEAISLGVVPMVSNCPSAMREIVTAAGSGIVYQTADSNSLANAIRDVIDSRFEWRSKAKGIREYFYRNLHIEICGSKLLHLCRTPRPGRLRSVENFPPRGLLPFHRKPYIGSRLNPRNLIQRWRFIRGTLPKPIT